MYISEKDILSMSVGNPVGDAKSLETRGVGIAKTEMKDGKLKQESLLKVGAVVYLNAEGEAVPFTDPAKDFAEVRRVPYGVAWTFNVKEDDYDLTPHTNEVTVVVDGVVPVMVQEGQTKPKKGDLVNPYGGALRSDDDVQSGMLMLTVLGVCDGVKGDLVAVRLAPSAANPRQTQTLNRDIKCIADEKINQNAWVYLSPTQPKDITAENVKPHVMSAGDGLTNKHIFGIAQNGVESPGEELTVRCYGVTYIPYVFKTSSKLAGIRASNGGKLPDRLLNRVTYDNGRVGWFLTALLAIPPLINSALNLAEGIYRMIKGGSSPAKCVDDVREGTPKFRELRAGVGGKYEVEPDGYIGVFVDTNVMAPSTLTEAPVLLDPPELDANGNMLIHEGRIYAGSSGGGVTRITAANASASSFFGVSAPNNVEDEEVNPPTKNGEPRIRLIREGNANVVANGDWKQGDYIDYLGRAIPADEEEFVPHIGKALDKAVGGELGSVDIRPFDPNNYIVVDYCNNSAKDIPLNTMVSVKCEILSGGHISSTIIDATDPAPDYDPNPLDGVVGVLTRFDEKFWDQESDYGSRAIIQVSGYLKCKIRTPADQSTIALLTSTSWVPYLRNGVVVRVPNYRKRYLDIIGQLMLPHNDGIAGDSHVDAWLLVNPRTVYYAGTTQSEDETEQ